MSIKDETIDRLARLLESEIETTEILGEQVAWLEVDSSEAHAEIHSLLDGLEEQDVEIQALLDRVTELSTELEQERAGTGAVLDRLGEMVEDGDLLGLAQELGVEAPAPNPDGLHDLAKVINTVNVNTVNPLHDGGVVKPSLKVGDYLLTAEDYENAPIGTKVRLLGDDDLAPDELPDEGYRRTAEGWLGMESGALYTPAEMCWGGRRVFEVPA